MIAPIRDDGAKYLPAFKFPQDWNIMFPYSVGFYAHQLYVYRDNMKPTDWVSIVVVRDSSDEKAPAQYEVGFDEHGEILRFGFHETDSMISCINQIFDARPAPPLKTSYNGLSYILDALNEYSPEPWERATHDDLVQQCKILLNIK